MRVTACGALLITLIAGGGCAHTEPGAGTGPVLTVAAAAVGRFDDNVRREQEALEAWGGGGELLVRMANRTRAPTLQLEYAASTRHSTPADPADGTGHRVNALAGVPIAHWLRLDMIGRGSRGGVDEDLSAADEVVVVTRLELQPVRSMRLRGYGAQRWREAGPAVAPTVGQYAGLEVRQRIQRTTTLIADARYEEFHPHDSSRDWRRVAFTVGIGRSLLRGTAFEAEVRARERRYPNRFVDIDAVAAPRRDEDWRYGIGLVHDNGTGTEFRLGFERDRRASNDPRRAYVADRVTLLLRRRLFGFGARNEPPRIDERPGTEAIRGTAAAGVAAHTRRLGDVLVAGTAVCAAAEDAALCWPSSSSSAAPVAVSGSWRRIAAASSRACGVDSDGRLFCWSWPDDHTAQNTRGTLMEPRLVRTDVRFADITIGTAHMCGLTTDGEAYCWGENGDGQLGNGTVIDTHIPARVISDIRFRSISAGGRHTCALDTNSAVHCWGANESGQAGAGSLRRSLRPKPLDGHHFVALTAGTRHTCALTADGRAWCWGENAAGQSGAAGGGYAQKPLPVSADMRFTAITAGWAHTCALTSAAQAFCWGANRYGQLGTGRTDTEAHPQPAAVAGDIRFIAIDASFRTCAIDDEHQVHCWGGPGVNPAGDAAAARPRRLATTGR